MVFIIDGNHLAARCFYAIDPLTTSKGKIVNVVYGFIISLRSMVKRWSFDGNHFFITWDAAGRKDRHELYPEYKANRKKFPDEFYTQIKDIQEIIKTLGIYQYQIEATEADDIIGTITRISRKHGKKVLIISSDHDFEQLVTKQISILSPSLAISKEKLKDYKFVTEKYGIEKPNQLIDIMALVGDPTDNVVGVEGVGAKIAVNLLKANGGLDNVLANVDELKKFDKKGNLKDASENIKDKIKNHVDTIKLNRQLVKINCFLDISVRFDRKQFDLDRLLYYFNEFEFKKFESEAVQWESIFTD